MIIEIMHHYQSHFSIMSALNTMIRYKRLMMKYTNIYFENDPLNEPKKCCQAKSSNFSGRWSKTQNGDQNRIYPSLTLRMQNFSLLKRVLKNIVYRKTVN